MCNVRTGRIQRIEGETVKGDFTGEEVSTIQKGRTEEKTDMFERPIHN